MPYFLVTWLCNYRYRTHAREWILYHKHRSALQYLTGPLCTMGPSCNQRFPVLLPFPGNVGFRAWPTMATAIAIAIVDYDGRLHPASSPLSRLLRKVRNRRNGPGHWRDTATEPPRHGRGRKVTPSRPGAPRNSEKVRTSIFHRFKFRS